MENTVENINGALEEKEISNLEYNVVEDKESQLLNQISEYETALEEEKHKVSTLEKLLETRTEERDNYINQTSKLEKELTKSILKDSKIPEKKINDMVTQAKSVIFEKTKVCKNQELQIEALKQQVASLKEIVTISKDMLDIRNMEVQQLQDKLSCMELQFTVEKDKQKLMLTKMEKMVKLNVDLKQEYEKQLALFTALQKAYHSRLNGPSDGEEKKEETHQ